MDTKSKIKAAQANINALRDEIEALKQKEKEERRQKWQEQLKIRQQEEEALKKRLFEECDVEDNPKADLCWAKAYEHGHSAGYDEVANCFYDLVELIK